MFPGQGRPSTQEDFQVSPRNPDSPKSRPIVRLYFIGTHVLRDGKPPIINIANRVIQMPPIGEFIDVTDLTANELMHRLAWAEKDNPTPIPGVTTSAEIARAVKAAYEAGDAENLDIRQMVANASLQSLPEAALIAELVRRGADVSQFALKPEVAQPEPPPAKKAKVEVAEVPVAQEETEAAEAPDEDAPADEEVKEAAASRPAPYNRKDKK